MKSKASRNSRRKNRTTGIIRPSDRARLGLGYEILEPKILLAVNIFAEVAKSATADVGTYYLPNAQQEGVARDFLSGRQETAYLFNNQNNLDLVEIKRGLASTVSRFQQTFNGVPVVDAYVTAIQGPTGEFVRVLDQGMAIKNSTPFDGWIPNNQYFQTVAMNHAGADRTFAPSVGQLVWLPTDNSSVEQVWQVTVFGVNTLTHGDFLTYIDIDSGTVISQENRIDHVDGVGQVFYPNPYQTQGNGTNLTDNNDANNATLTSQRINVTLQGLLAGTGLLRGDFVDLSTLNSPGLPDVDANEVSRVYDYTRDNDRFEQVVVYHTVDQINRYFHALGFDDQNVTPNGIRDFPTLANAHWDNADNSFYSTGDNAIHFGDGGVDDAEDGDIVAHEYGHAVQHDQNATWGGGEMGAMGEGFGDYLAATFFKTFGNAAFQAAHAAAVGEWDATSYSSDNPPNLRRVDGNKMYPGDLTGGVHADGEIWSRALWDMNNALGAAVADQIILESHFLLGGNATMVNGAEAILLADQNLNAGANQAAIRNAFVARGILQPIAGLGTVTLNSAAYLVGSTLMITVTDGNGVPPIQVTVTNSNGDTELLTLAAGGGGVYTGSIVSVAGAAVAGDGQLQAAVGNTVTVTYQDPNNGSGNPQTVTDSAVFGLKTQYNSTNVPLPITDNTTITSIINVPNAGVLLDVDLRLNITHTWVGDLTGVLIGPNGTRVTLFDRIGANGDNYTNTLFDDDAANSINSGSAPYAGTFRPSQPFSVFNGINPAGTWTLEIRDSANQDQGTLNSWSLFVSYLPVNTVIGPVTDVNAAINQVAENSANGTNVGITAAAIDPDGGDTVTYSLTNNAGGRFAINPSTGVVTVAGAIDFETATSHLITVRALSSDTSQSTANFTINVLNVNDATLTTSKPFYSGSSFDIAGGAVAAMANEKSFLVSGVQANFNNYTSYVRGLNGLVIDVKDLNQVPTLATVSSFFNFRVGNNNTPSGWVAPAAPTSLVYQSNIDANGTDRVLLTWADNEIRNEWLQVTLLANGTSGIATQSAFYFGNAVGETGNSATDALVNLQDLALTRANQTGFTNAGITNVYDFDRDNRVNLADIGFVRTNQSGFSPLLLITPSGGGSKGLFGKQSNGDSSKGNSNARMFVGSEVRPAVQSPATNRSPIFDKGTGLTDSTNMNLVGNEGKLFASSSRELNSRAETKSVELKDTVSQTRSLDDWFADFGSSLN